MGPSALEVADIFRAHGPAWRLAQRSHLSLGQLKVMSAIEQCRTAALGGHVLRCPDCEHDQVSYNSCRNRHCPKCQAVAAKRWLEARQADLLPVDYYHVVFTLPAPISDIAYYNKAVVYGLLFEIAAETLTTIAADPKHLGAEVGATLVLHTWGSALTHHPHVHGIVPGGGLSPDGKRWVSCKPGFFLSVRVLSRLFRRRFLEALEEVHRAGKLQFFGESVGLADPKSFAKWLAPLRKIEWVVYAKRPFAGPEAVLAYLSRYTHRVRDWIAPSQRHPCQQILTMGMCRSRSAMGCCGYSRTAGHWKSTGAPVSSQKGPFSGYSRGHRPKGNQTGTARDCDGGCSPNTLTQRKPWPNSQLLARLRRFSIR